MPIDEFDAYEPKNVAEELAMRQIELAARGGVGDSLAATREITDRTEGKAPRTVAVERRDKLDNLIIAYQQRVLSATGEELSRTEALARLVSYRPEIADAAGGEGEG